MRPVRLVRGAVPPRSVVPRRARSSAASSTTPPSPPAAPDFSRTFWTALIELLRHDAQAELKEGSYLITPSHRPSLPLRLLHEILPLHESLLRHLCRVPTWYLYSRKNGATMFPLSPSDPNGILTLPLYTQKPIPLPQTAASEIMELSLPSLIGNLPAVRKTQPRLRSLALEPQNFDFKRCIHLNIATAADDLSGMLAALQFEEAVSAEQPAVPRKLTLWVLQRDATLYASQLTPDLTAATATDPLLEPLLGERASEAPKPPEQRDLEKLGPHAHAFTMEGRALQFALKHKLLGTHRVVRTAAEAVFGEAKAQQQGGVYIHMSNGGVAMTLAD